jgi:predicted phosphodiesterase
MKQTTITRRTFLKKGWVITTLSMLPLGISNAFSFSKKTLRFGLITDTHYADTDTYSTRFFRESLAKMQEGIQVMNEEKVDFVIHLGDFKDQDPSKKTENTLQYLQTIEAEFAKFQGARYHCIGNHDVDSITKTQFLENIENTNIPKDKSYYSFDCKDFHGVVLDANFHPDGRNQFYLEEGTDWQHTYIPEEQCKWLTEDLKQTSHPVLVFCHHPLFEFLRDGKKYHVDNFEQIQKILQNSGKVWMVFQGHIHQEEVRLINKIQYYTQLAMIDYSGLENNSFSIVEIEPKGNIRIKGYKRVASKVLQLGK